MITEERTTAAFILDTVAPIFNRKGYVGTSLSDITEATRLTKGAIYCNFKNKEDLALQAFRKNVEAVLEPLAAVIRAQHNAIDKLLAITAYYRSYFPLASAQGGCPILNVGVDARHINPLLYTAARETVAAMVGTLETIIRKGMEHGQLRAEINPEITAKNIYAIIEGGICLSFLHEDESYLQNVLDLTDGLICELKKA
jgi:TetR/AcrR family transcriptional regulator, transcriptional repressor for nem operon